MIASLRSYAALARSVLVYHGDRARHRRMDALYAAYVGPGDLAFDIGSHVGDRISCFRRLGARVIALEPQPGPAAIIRLFHGRDGSVTCLQEAAGAEPGELTLRTNSRNPTVATISSAFVSAARDAKGWEGQEWDGAITVPVTTLDALIARYGKPRFIKIDVEGFEDQVLAGLTARVPALSFEFTTIARDVATACLERIAQLGPYRFNVAMGESQRFHFDGPVSADAMRALLEDVPHDANSGDVYAVLA
ncbi:FkbM family methyltransferase [Microvirga antarctica]|uniref:FkbM family methyltransferase n=1 Tax=Microvirga antarctica TaxID=2819233 RepID=UPI001B30E22F|nr:FkbM family methyltransferase [Microvirga antarctica]